jgi:hypothetical protein
MFVKVKERKSHLGAKLQWDQVNELKDRLSNP